MGLFGLLKRVKKKEIEDDLVDVGLHSDTLVKMAEEILLGRMTTASNGGGGFENVTLVECTGVVENELMHRREVHFKTDDSWITGVYYAEDHICKMYGEYLKTGKKPKIHPWRD